MVLWPTSWFTWAGISEAGPQSILLLQMLGAFLLPYALCAGLAARSSTPSALVAVLLAANVVDLLFIVHAGLNGALPGAASLLFALPAAAWCIVLFLLLPNGTPAASRHSLREALAINPSGSPLSLAERSTRRPQLLVFLRHSGCPFCRETLAQLSTQRERLSAAGVDPVIVGMEPPEVLTDLCARYGLGDVPVISDPARSLYDTCGMQKTGFMRFLSFRTLYRGLRASLQYGLGRPTADVFQLHGYALIQNEEIVVSRAAGSAGESCPINPSQLTAA